MVATMLAVGACGSTVGERAVTGGAIGAGTGAVIGSVTPFGTIPGLIVGGVAGAALGGGGGDDDDGGGGEGDGDGDGDAEGGGDDAAALGRQPPGYLGRVDRSGYSGHPFLHSNRWELVCDWPQGGWSNDCERTCLTTLS